MFLAAANLLSVGPAARLTDQDILSINAFRIGYAPLIAVARRNDFAMTCFENYCEFWTGKARAYFMYEIFPADPFEPSN